MVAKKKPKPKPTRAVALRAPAQQLTRAEHVARTLQELASDKSVDVAKYQAFVAMHRQALDDKRRANYAVAMKKAQARICAVVADRDNKQTSSRYATFPALDRMVRPVCTDLDLTIDFDTGDAPADLMVRVLLNVTHAVERDEETGWTRQFHVDIPADGKGPKGGEVMTRTHAAISAVTYGRSALLKMAFNIPVVSAADKRADDDGNAAGMEVVSDEQATAIINKLEEVGCPKDHFLEKAKITTVGEMPAARYAGAMSWLDAYKRERGAKQ